MGGRGAGSGRNQSGHSSWRTADDIARTNGISKEKAADQLRAIKSFTSGGYDAIRAAELNGDTKSEAGRNAIALEQFIAESPKWNGGPTFRGIGLSDNEFVAVTRVGSVNDLNHGTASWSTDRNMSMNYADRGMYQHGAKHKVIFVHDGKSQRGTSIRGLSSAGQIENEVIVSRKSRYKTTLVESLWGYTLIHVRSVG